MLIDLQILVSEAIIVDDEGAVIGAIDHIEIDGHTIMVVTDSQDPNPNDEDEVDPDTVDPLLLSRLRAVGDGE
jgi:hypothetical protein